MTSVLKKGDKLNLSLSLLAIKHYTDNYGDDSGLILQRHETY